MDLRVAIETIDKFLRSLKPTGDSGLEGLIAVLVERATNQEFRRASAGRQSGRDAASESGRSSSIKVETKHYKKTTRLNLRELIGEIGEAVTSDKNLDIWVLATSRHVDDQTASTLQTHAEETYGVEVFILDIGVSGLPRLAVLMGIFPDAVIDWANRHRFVNKIEEIQLALATLANASEFEPAKRRLISKLTDTIGYDWARGRINKELIITLSDNQNAKRMFRQPLGIRTKDSQVIRRAEVLRQLDEWWDSKGCRTPAVVLGEEGTGKTWAAFDWAIGRIERGDMPIVLPFSAVAEELARSEPLEALLPRLFAKWTHNVDENSWRRRLNRWFTSETTEPLLLLIVDGLNERADLEWRPFFSTILSRPWREKLAVLATDRPHHWYVRRPMEEWTDVQKITVEGYSPQELSYALSGSQISYSQIPPNLLSLISIPRYCRLVRDHYQEMIDAADFTRERLIYLEVKDRQASKLQYPLTDRRLFEIIRELAERARDNQDLNPKDLRSMIAEPGRGEANIYEEIVSGGLVVEVEGNAMVPAFRVEPLRLIFGFGMLLAEDLAKMPSASNDEIEEYLTSWFEPQPHMDRKVEICGSALFHALFHNDFPKVALKGLIRYWLDLRNWADTSQSAFTKYVLRRPEVFIEVAEEFWAFQRDSGAAQQFLGAAFAANRDHAKVQAVLVPAIERWMGFVHPLGRSYAEFDRPRNDQIRTTSDGQKIAIPVDVQKEERIRKEIEGRAGCPVVPGEIQVAGVTLTVVSDGYLLRLARFGLMIISAGDPSPFIRSLVYWAVASAVMDGSEFIDLVSWVIRLSDRDLDANVLEEARRLLERHEEVADDAARTLLLVVGSKESESLIEKHELTPEWYKERRLQHASDPCRSLYGWTENETVLCLGREDVSLHLILMRAPIPVVDPTIQIPASLIKRATGVLTFIRPEMIHAVSGRTSEDANLEMVTAILCAHAPSKLAAYWRGVVMTMPSRRIEGQYSLAVSLPQIALLLKSEELSAVLDTMTQLSADASEWQSEDHDGDLRKRQLAEAFAFCGIAPNLEPSDFFRLFIKRSINAIDRSLLEPWFAPVAPECASQAIELLHEPPNTATLRRILWTLPYLGFALSDLVQDRLVQIVRSEDMKIRSGAMRAVVVSHSQLAGRRIVDLGQSVGGQTDPWEEHWLTLLLAEFAGHLAIHEIAKRLRHSGLDYVIQQRGNQPEELDFYAKHLEQGWQQVISAVDPDIERLPAIKLNADLDHSGVPFPDLREPVPVRTIHLGLPRSWTSGPPTDPSVKLEDLFNTSGEERVRKLNQDMRSKYDAILAAWSTAAFQWYGREFNLQVMVRMYERSPMLIERWVQPALENSPYGFSARVRLGTFLEPICRVLLTRNSELGLKLWRVLQKREDNPVHFDAVDIAFGAEDGPRSREARKITLDECWNDASIAEVALACGKWDRRDWLDETILDLISAPRLWRRAKGLTLASFSDITQARFQEFVEKAGITGSWIEENLSSLRENVHKNSLARHWYLVFLNAEDSDVSWGALQIVLSLADKRLLNWRSNLENACENKERVAKRLRFLDLGWAKGRGLREEIDRGDERKDQFFGIKIQPGEIAPFI